MTQQQTSRGAARRLVRLFLSALAFSGMASLGASAQTGFDDPARADTVSWTVSAAPADAAAPGSKLVLTLQGTVQDGWHVYGLKQLPLGPTPLLVGLDKNDVAVAAGKPAGSKPEKVRDPSFGVDTEFYTRPFTISLPLRIGAHAAAGPQSIPVSVRFQTCNGRICQPPKSLRLSASVNVGAGK